VKRLFLSLLFGVSFPVIYTVVMVAISELFPTIIHGNAKMFGQPVPGYPFAPTIFPLYFATWLKVNGNFGLSFLIDTILFRFAIFVVPNILLYTGVGYLLCRVFRIPRDKHEKSFSSEPPPPSDFPFEGSKKGNVNAEG